MAPAHIVPGVFLCLEPSRRGGGSLLRQLVRAAGYAAMLIIPASQARSEASILQKEQECLPPGKSIFRSFVLIVGRIALQRCMRTILGTSPRRRIVTAAATESRSISEMVAA